MVSQGTLRVSISDSTAFLLYLRVYLPWFCCAVCIGYMHVVSKYISNVLECLFCSVPPTAGTYGADSVTQTEGTVIIRQGDPVRLNCTYQFSVPPYPFWYVQFPNQPPRLFLRDLGREDSDEGIRKGFDVTHDKTHKSFHLWKPSSELSDSGTYYCAASDTVTQTRGGAEQKPRREGTCGAAGRRAPGSGGDSGAERGEVCKQ
ncbi:unnamed protein product [Lepidochelys olivacea]